MENFEERETVAYYIILYIIYIIPWWMHGIMYLLRPNKIIILRGNHNLNHVTLVIIGRQRQLIHYKQNSFLLSGNGRTVDFSDGGEITRQGILEVIPNNKIYLKESKI